MPVSEEAGLEHAWNYFAFHANQRMAVFNFFIVSTGLILAGLGAIIQGPAKLSAFGVGLGLLLILLSGVYWQLDRRVSFMIKHSEAALGFAEDSSLPSELRIVRNEPGAFAAAKKQSWLWTYGRGFRLIFLCAALVGALGSTVSALRLAGVVEWTSDKPADTHKAGGGGDRAKKPVTLPAKEQPKQTQPKAK